MLRRLLFSLLPAALLVGLGEWAGRLFTEPLVSEVIFPHGYPGPPFVPAPGGRVRARFQDPDPSVAFTPTPEPGVPRVFVFGESSVRAGVRGIKPDMEFPSVLLGRMIPLFGRLEVVNLGKPGVDMAGISAIAREAAAYRPSLVVLYAGHNDVGNYTMRAVAPLVHRPPVALEPLGLYRLVRLVWAHLHAPAPPAYPPARQAEIVGGFEAALDAFLDLWAQAGVDVVLATPTSNIWTWHAGTPVCPAVSAEAWDIARTGAWSLRDDLPASRAEALYTEAPDCPEVQFVWGRARYDRGEREEGLRLLRRARDGDPLPLRANEGILGAIRARADRPGVHLVDVDGLWGAQGPEVRTRFHDLVHFEVPGHSAMADTLLPTVRAVLEARRDQAVAGEPQARTIPSSSP